MAFKIIVNKKFQKELKKIDHKQAELIVRWIKKNLDGTDNPKSIGKELQGNLKGIWRYRIGDYRLFANIQEQVLTIILLKISHRQTSYKK